MEGFLTILIFLGVIAVTALVFVGWTVATIVGFICRGIGALFAPAAPPVPHQGIRCVNEQCRAFNPAPARFCRRCGKSLPQPQIAVVHRRAALW